MIIGVDIGGTKTLVASFVGGDIVREDKFATSKDSAAFFADVLNVLASHTRNTAPDAISIAAPGIIDHHRGMILRCGNLPWQNVPVRQLLRRVYDTHIYIENDANLAGLAEAHALPDIPRLCLYLTVSTGIGSGIIINGDILPALSASEAGHMSLKKDNSFMIWERSASGKSLNERTGQFASQIKDAAVWQDVAERVGTGLLALIPALQPSVIVIGGSIGGFLDAHWRSALETFVSKNLSPYIDQQPILQAQQPGEAVVYGCRIFAEQRLAAL